MKQINRVRKNFMEYKPITKIYYNGKLQQTFIDVNDAFEYIEHQAQDPNCERRKFQIK